MLIDQNTHSVYTAILLLAAAQARRMNIEVGDSLAAQWNVLLQALLQGGFKTQPVGVGFDTGLS